MEYDNESASKFLFIDVVDTGVGIDEKGLKILFRAYTKIMKNRENNKEGCGLGLKISKNLAKALGGYIDVTSKVGEGSTFSLRIPYVIYIEKYKSFTVQTDPMTIPRRVSSKYRRA